MQTEEILRRAAEYRAVREALGVYRIELRILPAGTPVGRENEPGRAGAEPPAERPGEIGATPGGCASPLQHAAPPPAPEGHPAIR